MNAPIKRYEHFEGDRFVTEWEGGAFVMSVDHDAALHAKGIEIESMRAAALNFATIAFALMIHVDSSALPADARGLAERVEGRLFSLMPDDASAPALVCGFLRENV